MVYQQHSTTVIRLTGTAQEVFALFALFVRERGDIRISDWDLINELSRGQEA